MTATSPRLGALLLIASILLAGCMSAPPAPGASTSATGTVGPAGGEVKSADGRVTLAVPAGALAASTTIEIKPATSAATGLPANVTALTRYTFSPSGLVFAKPARLTVRVPMEGADPSQTPVVVPLLKDGAKSTALANVKMRALTGSVILEADVPHFSDVTLLWPGIWAQVSPATAERKVGETLDLKLRLYRQVNELDAAGAFASDVVDPTYTDQTGGPLQREGPAPPFGPVTGPAGNPPQVERSAVPRYRCVNAGTTNVTFNVQIKYPPGRVGEVNAEALGFLLTQPIVSSTITCRTGETPVASTPVPIPVISNPDHARMVRRLPPALGMTAQDGLTLVIAGLGGWVALAGANLRHIYNETSGGERMYAVDGAYAPDGTGVLVAGGESFWSITSILEDDLGLSERRNGGVADVRASATGDSVIVVGPSKISIVVPLDGGDLEVRDLATASIDGKFLAGYAFGADGPYYIAAKEDGHNAYLWTIPAGGGTASMGIDLGQDPKQIDCAGGVCAVTDHAGGSVTTFTHTADGTATKRATIPVGDGPVGLDARFSDGEIEVIVAAMLENAVLLLDLNPDGTLKSTEQKDAPEGCQPAGVAWLYFDLRSDVGVTCHETDVVFAMTMGLF